MFSAIITFLRLRLSLKSDPLVAVLIGLVVGLTAFCLALFLASDKNTDLGGNSVGLSQTEQNLGAQYKNSWELNRSLTVGVTKVFAVPVWDNGQGLGNRMPNLITQPSQSPTIFLGTKLPVEYIVLLRNLFAILGSLVILNLTVLSWSNWRLARRLFFLDISILGPHFLYTSINGWYHQADQFWGICLIVSGFLHASWYQTHSDGFKPKSSLVVLTAFVLGLGNLLVGHVLYFQIIFFATVYLLVVHLARFRLVLGSVGICLLSVLVGVLVVPQIVELANQQWNSATVPHSSQTSLLDFFQPRDGWVYRYQPILAFVAISFQPLLRFFGDAGSRTEFFNFLFVPYILVVYLRHRLSNSSMIRMVRHSFGALLCLFSAAIFVGAIQRANVALISKAFDFHVWQLSQPILILITATAAIVLGNREWAGQSSTNVPLISIRRFVLPLALFVGLIYPVVMVTEYMHLVNPKIINDQKSVKKLASINDLLGLSLNVRHVFIGNPNFENELTGSAEAMELQRAGYPSIQSITYGRSSSTLRYADQSFRSVFDPSVLDCQPEVLDLLAVNAIVFEIGADDVCSENLRNYYRSSDEISFNKVAGKTSVISAKPRQFSSWSIDMGPESNPIKSCPLFEKNCLSGLTVTKLEPDSGAPFKLCEDKCAFTYRWSAPASSKQVLVPENYDQTIQIRDLSTGVILNTANYQGLLAVEIPSGATYGEFEGTIKPDAMMWARVSATYLHTLVLLATLLLIAVRGFRARRSGTEVVTAS